MSEMMTRDDELKLLGIKAIAESHNKALAELIPIVREITGDVSTEEGGWSGDFVYDETITPKKLWEMTAKARAPRAA